MTGDGEFGRDGLDERLRPTAELVREVVGTGRMRPAFRDRLRRELVAARAVTIARGTRPTAPVRRRRRRPVWGWAAAAAAVVVAIAVLVGTTGPFTGPPSRSAVSVATNLDGAVSASATAVLRLTFSRPLDHATTLAALRLAPAARVSTRWDGETLTVRPAYGFAPDSAYVLTVDHTVARTASGVPLATDLHVVFGTAPAPAAASGSTAFALPDLVRVPVAAADPGSEAVVTRDGSLLLTAARPGGLVRVAHGTSTTLAAAAGALCQSRSGQSVAYVSGTGPGTRIVFADAQGNPTGTVPAEVDPGSPLGWVDDAQVVVVGGGRLRAVDRAGTVTTLADTPVRAGRDTVVVAPGGRYVFVGPPSGGTGRVLDLRTRTGHPLPGVTGQPAFSADGATVAWFDGSSGATVLDLAPSGGGPVLAVPLPVQPGDRLGDLALSPDGYHVVYSVGDELRLAALPDGRTLAVSGAGGQSPNWSASGGLLTVLTAGRIDAVAVTVQWDAALDALASAFARAQVSRDLGAMRALAAPDATLPNLPAVTRATALWIQPSNGGTATARIRLTVDPVPGDPVTRQAEETLTLAPRPGGGLPRVPAVAVGEFRPAPDGPQLLGVDTTTSPGTARLSFDADLDPGTVPVAVGLVGPDGRTVPAMVGYDSATRTVTVAPTTGTGGPMTVQVGTGLRDVDGHGPPDPFDVPLVLPPA